MANVNNTNVAGALNWTWAQPLLHANQTTTAKTEQQPVQNQTLFGKPTPINPTPVPATATSYAPGRGILFTTKSPMVNVNNTDVAGTPAGAQQLPPAQQTTTAKVEQQTVQNQTLNAKKTPKNSTPVPATAGFTAPPKPIANVNNTDLAGAPAWAQQLTLSHQTFMAKAEHQAIQIQTFMAKAEQQASHIQTLCAKAIQINPTPVPATAISNAPRKEILPELATFSGTKSEFRPWLTQAHAKLDVDLKQLSESERFWYIHSRLREKAAGQVEAWITAMKRDGIYSVEALFGQLRLAYDNPESTEIAAQKLGAIRQGGRESFAMFLPGFHKTMLEAGSLHWDEQVKKIFLNMAISMDLQEALVATPIPATYTEYCSLLHAASKNLESLRARKKRDVVGLSTANRAPENFGEKSTENSAAEDTDWSPTNVASSSIKVLSAKTSSEKRRTQWVPEKRRAQWASQATIEERRGKEACFRCGGIGHKRDNFASASTVHENVRNRDAGGYEPKIQGYGRRLSEDRLKNFEHRDAGRYDLRLRGYGRGPSEGKPRYFNRRRYPSEDPETDLSERTLDEYYRYNAPGSGGHKDQRPNRGGRPHSWLTDVFEEPQGPHSICGVGKYYFDADSDTDVDSLSDHTGDIHAWHPSHLSHPRSKSTGKIECAPKHQRRYTSNTPRTATEDGDSISNPSGAKNDFGSTATRRFGQRENPLNGRQVFGAQIYPDTRTGARGSNELDGYERNMEPAPVTTALGLNDPSFHPLQIHLSRESQKKRGLNPPDVHSENDESHHGRHGFSRGLNPGMGFDSGFSHPRFYEGESDFGLQRPSHSEERRGRHEVRPLVRPRPFHNKDDNIEIKTSPHSRPIDKALNNLHRRDPFARRWASAQFFNDDSESLQKQGCRRRSTTLEGFEGRFVAEPSWAGNALGDRSSYGERQTPARGQSRKRQLDEGLRKESHQSRYPIEAQSGENEDSPKPTIWSERRGNFYEDRRAVNKHATDLFRKDKLSNDSLGEVSLRKLFNTAANQQEDTRFGIDSLHQRTSESPPLTTEARDLRKNKSFNITAAKQGEDTVASTSTHQKLPDTPQLNTKATSSRIIASDSAQFDTSDGSKAPSPTIYTPTSSIANDAEDDPDEGYSDDWFAHECMS